MKYCVAQQQCKGNPVLNFSINSVHIYIVDNYIYARNNKKETSFCISKQWLWEYATL